MIVRSLFRRLWTAGCLLALSACSSLPQPPSVDPVSPVAVGPAAPARTLAPETARIPDAGAGLRAPAGPGAGLKPLAPAQVNSFAVHALTPPVDLWDRIRRHLAMPDLDNDLVRERERWYQAKPDYVARMTERSRKYLFHIVEEVERRGLPSELALLPFIESAFNPEAVSRAKATGMWQFMPATGRTFDLRQNMFHDDRRDVLASTRAALDYLQKLYRMFGDWHLALAAYNWGEGNVQRAIAKAQKAGLPTDYARLKMPMETQMYVPKLQALKNVLLDPPRYDVPWPDIPNHPYFQTVDLDRDIDVTVAAQLAEIPVPDLRSLNPGANKPVLLAATTPQILLPWDNATRFETNRLAWTAPLATWTTWVAPGTLKLRDVAQRVGMTEAELRAVNGIPPRMQVRAGSTLLVRRGRGVQADVSLQTADQAQLSLMPEVLLRKTRINLRKGETLAALARRLNVTEAQLRDWNKLQANAQPKAGQALVALLPLQAARTYPGKTRAAAPRKVTVSKAPLRKSGPRVAKR